MKREGHLDRLLERARDQLEPTAMDALRLRKKVAEQLSGESGVHRSEPLREAGSGSPGDARAVRPWSRVSQLVAVGLVAGTTGFLLGRATDGQEVPPAAPPERAQRASQSLAPRLDAAGKADEGAVVAERPMGAEQEVAFDAISPNVAAPTPATTPARQQVRPQPSRRRTNSARAAPVRPPSAEQPRDAAVEIEGMAAARERHDTLDLRAALDLMRRAEAQRQAGQPESALRLLSELEARAPDLLVEERLVTAVLCECDLGNTAHARSRVRAVGDSNQSSIYERRLRSSCAADALGPK
jgi:hypothetical protein